MYKLRYTNVCYIMMIKFLDIELDSNPIRYYDT